MKLTSVILIAPLAACASSSGGPIAPDNRESTYRFFLKQEHPMVFALSENGRSWGYYYCDEVGLCDHAEAKATALRQCRRGAKGSSCRIYYEAPHGVVWDGPPVAGMDAPAGPRSQPPTDVERIDLPPPDKPE